MCANVAPAPDKKPAQNPSVIVRLIQRKPTGPVGSPTKTPIAKPFRSSITAWSIYCE